MPLCCWDDCNADNADGARLFKIYIRFSAPTRGFIHSWLWVRNNHLLKQTITMERAVMAEIMSSCGEGARALRGDAASHVCLSELWIAPSEKSDPIEHFLRNKDLCHFQALLLGKLLGIVPLNFTCCDITSVSSLFPVATAFSCVGTASLLCFTFQISILLALCCPFP